MLAENRFLAARDGTCAQLIDPKRSIRGALTELLGDCQSIALRLVCADELAAASALADDPGAARQRRLAALDGIGATRMARGPVHCDGRRTYSGMTGGAPEAKAKACGQRVAILLAVAMFVLVVDTSPDHSPRARHFGQLLMEADDGACS